MRTPLLIAATLGLSLGLSLASSLATASTGGGFNFSSSARSSVDQQYEDGKAYYKSRQADGSRLEYCVKGDDSFEKLSRHTVRPFKRGPASEFVSSLYSCDDPDLKIADALSEDEGTAILYYLNKRFKLRLANG